MNAQVKCQQDQDAEAAEMSSTLPPLAFLCHPMHRGGVTRWMVDAALAWSRNGGRCWFVAPRLESSVGGSAKREGVVDLITLEQAPSRLRVVTCTVDETFQFGTRSNRVFRYAKLLRSGVPSSVAVIVSDDQDVWSAGATLAQRNPIVGVLHSDEKKYYDLARKHCANLSALVAVSRRIAANARACVDVVPITEIACGVPMPVPLAADRPLNDVARLVWVGRIDERQKRVTDLPRIVAALRDSGTKAELHVIGDGPDKYLLEQIAADLKISHAVTLHGWCSRNQVRALVATCDLLILPSNFEGMPLVVMEALAFGVGVIASRTSGIEDVADSPLSDGCFWTYATGDVPAAVAHVESALAVSAEERRRRATNFAQTQFDIDRCVERYRDLLTGLPTFTARDSAPARWSMYLAACASYPLSLWRLRSLRAGAKSGHEHSNV